MHSDTRAWPLAMLAAAALSMPVAAQSLSTGDFAKALEVNEVTLSPDGKHVALAIPSADGMETQLEVLTLDGSGQTQVLRFGRQEHVANVLWSSDDQLVVSRAHTQPMKAQPVSFGELMSSDIRGKNQELLFGYVRDNGARSGRRKDQGFAYVHEMLENEPGIALVQFECWEWVCGEESPSVVFKVDTRTGHRQEIERSKEPASFTFDRSGRARIRVTSDDDDEPVLHYRPTAESEWVPVPKALAGRSLNGYMFEPDNNTLYALVADKGEPAGLYKLDLRAGTRTKLAGRDDVEIASIMTAGRDGVPVAVTYNADKPSIQYLDRSSEWVQLHAGLLKLFPGEMITFDDYSRDGRKVLFRAWSDRHVSGYYLFDRDAKKAQLLAEAAPWLKAERLATVKPIEFTARDGRKLFGFYTASGTGPKPLVVMAHGGPHGPYDHWGYDADAQFLASRGYAVLQVNYRGSGGRGRDFMEAGYREWGGKIMDDIADGVRWTIDNKLADPQRICTYGASFGGYAALMNPIRYPELYKCAIGYVGVYDLAMMHAKGDIQERKSGERFIDRAVGTDPAFLRTNSPVQQVAKLQVPVFLIHGKNDRRVPIAHFDAMKAALSAAQRPAETFVMAGEGHGFYKPENQEELYRRIEAFLDKHIGPRAN